VEAFGRLGASNQQEISRLKAVVKELQASLDSAFDRARSAEQNTIDAENRYVEALAQSSKIVQSSEQLAAAVASVKQELECTQDTKSGLERKLMDLEQQLNTEQATVAQAQALLRAELHQSVEENRSLRTDLLSSRQVSSEAQAANEQLTADNQSLRDTVVRLTADIESLKAQLVTCEQTFARELDLKEQLQKETISNHETKIDGILEEHRTDRLRLLATTEGRLLEARRLADGQLEAVRLVFLR
jgi:chromosome segregation ATPase